MLFDITCLLWFPFIAGLSACFGKFGFSSSFASLWSGPVEILGAVRYYLLQHLQEKLLPLKIRSFLYLYRTTFRPYAKSCSIVVISSTVTFSISVVIFFTEIERFELVLILYSSMCVLVLSSRCIFLLIVQLDVLVLWPYLRLPIFVRAIRALCDSNALPNGSSNCAFLIPGALLTNTLNSSVQFYDRMF